MHTFLKETWTAVLATFTFTVILCGVYPMVVFVLAQGMFPQKANGSLVFHKGRIIGSELLGQPFDHPAYFHPRPSAAGKGYDAMASCGSNLGPTSSGIIDAITEQVRSYRSENDIPETVSLPADAIMASGSGLDPHISLRNALLQVNRVAGVRRLDSEALKEVVSKAAEGRTFGILGEPRVNVLTLNLLLDEKYNTEK